MFLCFGGVAVAQLEFSCIIKDEVTGKALAGAKVEILNRDTAIKIINASSSNSVTISNKDGEASFKNLLPGNYMLSVVHAGHESKKLSLPLLSKSIAITINLTPLPTEMESKSGKSESVFKRIGRFFKRTLFGR
jgi:hypothetical protein